MAAFAKIATLKMADGNTTYNNTALNAPERMLLRGLGRLVVRYAICDLNQQTYTFYNPTDEPNVPLGNYKSFAEGMVAQLHITGHIDELQNATSPENIRAELAEADGLYRYDYVGNVDADDVFYRLSVMPLEFHEDALCTYLVLVMDVTDTHRREMRTEQALKEGRAP